MSVRTLPILSFAPFRSYPTRLDQQSFGSEQQVCESCLSGACCSSEHPIALRRFDIARLAALFEMTPAVFLRTFTQDRFQDEESDQLRTRFLEDPGCSIVTYLRRRENSPTSPCIFLKYTNDPDGTPRRVCSVYDARPLACREFYFDTCKTRVTGELAALLAEGFEKIREGEITESLADAHLSGAAIVDPLPESIASQINRAFWTEMKRAANPRRANNEGANSYNIASFQDPVEEKLSRHQSKSLRRLRRRYGPRLRDELAPFQPDGSFGRSAERRRIMKIVEQRPSAGVFESGDYRGYVGVRTLISGVKHRTAFATVTDSELNTFLRGIPRTRLFPPHANPEVRAVTLRDVYASILKGYNHIIRFAGYFVALDGVPELARYGDFEIDMLSMITGFHTSVNPFLATNRCFDPITTHLAEVTLGVMERASACAESPREVFDVFSVLSRVNIAAHSLAPESRARFEGLTRAIRKRLRKDRLDLYVSLTNPVEERRKAGKRLADGGAWSVLYDQVLDIRYASVAGFKGIDLAGYYRQMVGNLESIPFRKSYGLDLYNVVRRLARSMSFENTIAYRDLSYKDAADRLAGYAVRLFDWMEDTGFENHDCEIIAEFPSPIFRGLGLSYNHNPGFGLITYRILDAQQTDGSWKTNPTSQDAPGNQTDYLKVMYSATWACIDALRPLRTDLLNPENSALGLV